MSTPNSSSTALTSSEIRPSCWRQPNCSIHMGRIFRDNSVPPHNPAGIRIDSKRRKRLTEKRMAMGHKADDHEEQVSYQQTM